jgi:hypothetical protein
VSLADDVYDAPLSVEEVRFFEWMLSGLLFLLMLSSKLTTELRSAPSWIMTLNNDIAMRHTMALPSMPPNPNGWYAWAADRVRLAPPTVATLIYCLPWLAWKE